MNHRRSAKRWIAAIALSGLVAVGCSPTNTEPAESDNGDAGAEVDASGDSDQVLRAAYQYGTSSLDPHTNTGAYSPVTLGLIFDTLIQVTSDGNLVPGLAEDWNFSEDKTELILDIREGVTFHDGTSLDAETVKLNLDRARGVDFDNSAVSGDLSMISDVAVDGNQVIISLEDGEGGTLPAILSDRAGMIASA